MISVELARRLRAAGLAWEPSPGDRFVIAGRDMDAEVFVISELTIEVHDAPTGRLLRFNGTTEWALDSVEADAVVWLPREDQLRAALGPAFRALHPLPAPTGPAWVVTTSTRTAPTGGDTTDSDTADGADTATDMDTADVRHIDPDPENAYARALLATLLA